MTEPLHCLKVSDKTLAAVEFMPDGKLYVASVEPMVKRWDPATGETDQTLLGHGGPVIAMATAVDGRILGTCSMDGSAWIWLTAYGAKAFNLKGFKGIPAAITFAPDASIVVTGASDKVVRLHELQRGKLTNELEGHTGEVLAVAVCPSKPLIASGGAGDPIRLWQFPSGEQSRTIDAHPVAVLALKFTHDGASLISTGADDVLRIWDTTDWSMRMEVPLGGPGTHLLSLSPTRAHVAVTMDGAALVVDLEAGKILAELPIPGVEVYGVSYSFDGDRLATASADGQVRVWDVEAVG